MNLNINEIIKIVLITFLCSALLVPFIKSIAEHVGALDIPDKRKVHKEPIPRLGGLAIFFSFLLGYMLFSRQSIEMIAILIGSFIVVLTGIIDDIKPLRARHKFAGQVVAALVVVLYGGIVLTNISAFGLSITFNPIVAKILTTIFILGCINCINLIDGLDGLAGGISSIYFLTIGVVAVIMGQSSLDTSLTFIMLGATLGFLVHNFHPAKIFMGDSGSMFLGFIISVIALLGFKNVTFTSFIVPLFVLAIPILDTLFAIIRRLLKKQHISEPDKSHLHHQFLNMRFSHRNTVLIIYIIDILFALASIIYVLKDPFWGQVIYSILLIIVVWLVSFTDIITSKKPLKKGFDKIKTKLKKNK
ncbi:MAG: undecaprenyl/decaprenyl-phosphate alpha-N-acetylglucosaminyl 1-phosphate transferase [Firmicutes bacterium]|nr:undecaprenyl/decaprenyl-phosphate alpha-N-acetylglucosaminyl 1-phosphate transferase [Bacillota bacterium]